MTSASERAKAATPRSLSGLLPFLRPYRWRIVAAIVFLVAASLTTLAFPVALRKLIDGGLGVFSALRFYSVTWLGERITADLRNAVYRHVVKQSPAFFETNATGEVL